MTHGAETCAGGANVTAVALPVIVVATEARCTVRDQQPQADGWRTRGVMRSGVMRTCARLLVTCVVMIGEIPAVETALFVAHRAAHSV